MRAFFANFLTLLSVCCAGFVHDAHAGEKESFCNIVFARISESNDDFDVSHPAYVEIGPIPQNQSFARPRYYKVDLSTGVESSPVQPGAPLLKAAGKLLGVTRGTGDNGHILFLDGRGDLHVIAPGDVHVRDMYGRQYEVEKIPTIGDSRLQKLGDRTLSNPAFGDKILGIVAQPPGADSNRAYVRRALLPLLAHHPDEAKVKSVLMDIVKNDPDPLLRAQAVAFLWRLRRITDDDVSVAVQAKFDPPTTAAGEDSSVVYWRGLQTLFHQASVDWDRMNAPVLYQIPAAALAHSNADIRHFGINHVRYFREWRVTQAAMDRLRTLLPELRGHALDAARFALRQKQTTAKAIPEVSGAVASVEEHPLFRKLLEDTEDDRKQFGLPTNSDLAKEVWNRTRISWPEPAAQNGPHWQIQGGADQFDPQDYGHSMPDFDKYLRDRLGAVAVDLIRADKVSVLVYGGSRDTLLSTLPEVRGENIAEVPSPYSQWGVHKYFVHVDGDTKPLLIYQIPPILDYALHYHGMVHGSGNKKPTTIVDEGDRQKYIQKWKQSAARIAEQLDSKPEILILGYHNQWIEKLRHHPEWELMHIKGRHVHDDDMDLTGRAVTVRNRFDPSITKTFLLLKSEKTLWGEASAHLTEASIGAFPTLNEVWFMGSAGAPTDSTHGHGATPYTVSVPRAFENKEGKVIPLVNSISEPVLKIGRDGQEVDFQGQPRTFAYVFPARGKFPVDLMMNGHHGYSASPSLQTRGSFMTDEVLKLSVPNTIDVETSLVAQAIASQNEKRKQQGLAEIKFGAVHIVTDFPAGLNTYDVDHSLSAVGNDTKSKARYHLIDTTLDFFSQRFYQSELFANYGRGVSWAIPNQEWRWLSSDRRPIPVEYKDNQSPWPSFGNSRRRGRLP